jgi:hypothetical protein
LYISIKADPPSSRIFSFVILYQSSALEMAIVSATYCKNFRCVSSLRQKERGNRLNFQGIQFISGYLFVSYCK